MSSVKRIIKFIESQHISKSAFYKKTGFSNGYLDKVKDLGADKIEIIISSYANLNLDWLITGNGPMLKEESTPTQSIVQKDLHLVPLIPISAMAGYGTGETTIMNYDIKDLYTVPDFNGIDFMIRVKGSSMVPKYNSGDVVACKKLCTNDIFFQWGKVYVLDTDQGALIKRIKKGSDSEHLLIVSDNKDYEPFELALDRINAIALVVGVIRLE